MAHTLQTRPGNICIGETTKARVVQLFTNINKQRDQSRGGKFRISSTEEDDEGQDQSHQRQVVFATTRI